ncbi:hypothetical protein AB0F71_18635 [Kitasatospora sp. NPDC028055]|uniref:hypothetical protein n=1 Tax=Kitasatospora sp. NPDC028055 TaxID=3155653 RepID=UPI0033C7C96F
MTDELFGAIDRIGRVHAFAKGMGIAAPQIGIPRAAAILLPPTAGTDPNAAVTELRLGLDLPADAIATSGEWGCPSRTGLL